MAASMPVLRRGDEGETLTVFPSGNLVEQPRCASPLCAFPRSDVRLPGRAQPSRHHDPIDGMSSKKPDCRFATSERGWPKNSRARSPCRWRVRRAFVRFP